MQEYELDHSIFQRPAAGDDKLFVVFFPHYVKDDQATEKEGRPVFRDEVFIRIITPGDRDNVVERPIRPEDKLRFPKQWAIYQQGEEQIGLGLRLEEWPLVSRAQVEELKFFGFRTVEHLAEANDSICAKMTGLRKLKERAEAYLQVAKENAPMEKLQTELSKRDEQIAALQAQVEQMAKQLPTEGKVPVQAKKVA